MGKWFGKRKSALHGKHVLVTGGTEGIGLEIAKEAVSRGALVTVCSRSSDKVNAAVATLQAHAAQQGHDNPQRRVFGAPADVTHAGQLASVKQAGEAALGPVDVLVSNAGLSIPGFLVDQDVSVFEKTMRVNYLGAVTSIKTVLPDMLARRQGKIVVVSSAAIYCSFAGYTSYTPTKWAMRGLCDCLRSELLGTGVTVHLATPPDTDTPGFAEENKIKPQLVHDLTKAVGGELVSPQAVARCMFDSLERGRYHLSTPDFGINLLINLLAGFTPANFPLVLQCFMAPVTLLVVWFLRQRADAVARRYNKEQSCSPRDKSK